MALAEFVEIDGLRLRVSTQGTGRPLLLLNGIGAPLELFAPLRSRLPQFETIAVDVPGCGGSQTTRLPLSLCGIARLINRLLDVLGYREVDVLGISWGGALAQEFARRHGKRVRKLVLVATSPGWLMLPGRLGALWIMATPRRYYSPTYFDSIAATLYGGAVRENPHLLREQGHMRFLQQPTSLGYLWQILGAFGWSSLPWLGRLRMPVLVMAGDDDPIIPLANARLIAWCLKKGKLEVIKGGGHLFLLTHIDSVTPQIVDFLLAP